NTGPHQLLVGGNNGYLAQLDNGVLTQIAMLGSNDWNDIKFGKDSIGWAVGTGGLTAYANKLTYHSLTNDVEVSASSFTQSLAGFNAVHIFNDNNFIAVGPDSTVSYFDGFTTSFIGQTHLIQPGTTLNDVFFHDDRNGYVV